MNDEHALQFMFCCKMLIAQTGIDIHLCFWKAIFGGAAFMGSFARINGKTVISSSTSYTHYIVQCKCESTHHNAIRENP